MEHDTTSTNKLGFDKGKARIYSMMLSMPSH